MHTRAIVCTALVALLTTAASAQQSELRWKPPMSTASAGDYLDSRALFEAGMIKHWQLALPLAPGQRVTDTFLVDDQIYAGTNDGHVYAIHAPTGALRWVRQFTRGGYLLRRPTHIGERTVIGTPPSVMHYDRLYGKPIRKQNLRFPLGNAPVSDGVSLLLGGLDRRMYSFGVNDDFEQWKIGADSQLVSGPALYGESLFFASDRGTIYACAAANKAFQWINRSIGPVTADLVADENGVYVASRDRSLYLLDPAFGKTRWRVRFSGALHEAPVPTPKIAFQFSPSDGLVAVDADDVNLPDRELWRLENGRKLLTIDEESAYVLSRDGKLLVCDLDSGTVRHEVATGELTMPMPFTKLPVVYLASPDGRIFAARKRGVRVVTADSVLAAMDVPKDTQTEPAAEDRPDAARETLTREDVLGTRQGGPPIGGKSKVSREFQEPSSP